mgnify:CR=1 FL=1
MSRRISLLSLALAATALLAALTPTPDQRILKSGCRIEDRRLASRKIAEHHNILNCI